MPLKIIFTAFICASGSRLAKKDGACHFKRTLAAKKARLKAARHADFSAGFACIERQTGAHYPAIDSQSASLFNLFHNFRQDGAGFALYQVIRYALLGKRRGFGIDFDDNCFLL